MTTVYRLKARRKQAGFTLIELMVVLAIMGIMAVANVPNFMNQINEKRANKTVVDTQAILDAARTYRSETGAWPGNGTCTDATSALRSTSPPMLAGVTDTNPYNAAISTSCTAKTFSVDQNLISGWDAVVVNTLPGAQLVNAGASTVRSTIGVPGSEAGLDSKLSRVNTGDPQMNRMETDLLLGGHNINEVNDVNAKNVNVGGIVTTNQANITGRASFNEFVELKNAQAEGTTCPSTGLTSRNATGQPLNCMNGVWAKPVTWYPGTVAGGGGCGSFPAGSLAFDASGKLNICK
ncbi:MULTISPECIES: type II secretion system protein [Pseudomonas]|uniref:Pili assembly chaperone n=1 Tax=Pseudomonas fluorescens TaxID=294 RepID=A0A166QQB5_PSEFL|nr:MULTISPECIES: type II secretion system protein [Pseudomonas]KZN20681.1 pili assembly chaperone [Pseudomonas fluorescens]